MRRRGRHLIEHYEAEAEGGVSDPAPPLEEPSHEPVASTEVPRS